MNNDLPDPTDSAPLNGELIMSGGTINARWMNLGQLKGNGNAELSGDAAIYLWPNLSSQPNNGGHLSFNRDWFLFGQPVPSTGMVSFDIRDDAAVYIFGHESQAAGNPNQSEVARYQAYVDDGMLTANSGSEAPIISLEPCPMDGSLDDYCVNSARMMIKITAPIPVIPGDFDNDGQHTCADVDALVADIAAGNNMPSFDLTGDSLVDSADLTSWLESAGIALGFAGPVLPADADLNGSVDGGDFLIWNSFKFTSGNFFCGGDFNADGATDGADFLIWNSVKFTNSDIQTVPEPACFWLVGLFVCCMKLRR